MSTPPRQLSILIPAYNEGEGIQKTLAAACEALAGLDFDLIVVDDGSRDATHTYVQQAAEGNPRILPLRYDVNRGKGNALRHGFAQARGERVAFLDADLDLHPRLLRELMAVMDQTQADVVIGSKLHPDSQVDYPVWRRVLSLGYYFLIRLLFGLPVQDTQTGIKLFRREVLAAIFPLLTIEGYAFDLQLLVLAHQRGYRITSAPVVLNFQRQRLGRIGLPVVWQILRDTLSVFRRTR
jgi:glycosyltransferase involved in cell wall biosynthesis